jgi:hypothetical protein
MGRGRVRLAGLGLLASAWLLGTPGGARAEAVVIAATAPGYATGQRLGDGPIAVPDGASLVFLVETGQVVTVKGPYDGPPPAPKADAAGRLGRLARLGGTDQSQIGGTRGLANPEDLARAVPLDLYLATDRGRYPAYRPGEPLGLVLQANRDAYAYCWLRTGRGRVLPVFPVRAEDTGPLQGGQTLRLVGDGRPGVVAGPELDEAQLRCMAAPEPLEPDLAQAFVDSHARALPAPLAERLEAAVVARDPGGKAPDVVLAQLVLRVEGP